MEDEDDEEWAESVVYGEREPDDDRVEDHAEFKDGHAQELRDHLSRVRVRVRVVVVGVVVVLVGGRWW